MVRRQYQAQRILTWANSSGDYASILIDLVVDLTANMSVYLYRYLVNMWNAWYIKAYDVHCLYKSCIKIIYKLNTRNILNLFSKICNFWNIHLRIPWSLTSMAVDSWNAKKFSVARWTWLPIVYWYSFSAAKVNNSPT